MESVATATRRRSGTRRGAPAGCERALAALVRCLDEERGPVLLDAPPGAARSAVLAELADRISPARRPVRLAPGELGAGPLRRRLEAERSAAGDRPLALLVDAGDALRPETVEGLVALADASGPHLRLVVATRRGGALLPSLTSGGRCVDVVRVPGGEAAPGRATDAPAEAMASFEPVAASESVAVSEPEPVASEPVAVSEPEPVASEPVAVSEPEPVASEPVAVSEPEPVASEPVAVSEPEEAPGDERMPLLLSVEELLDGADLVEPPVAPVPAPRVPRPRPARPARVSAAPAPDSAARRRHRRRLWLGAASLAACGLAWWALPEGASRREVGREETPAVASAPPARPDPETRRPEAPGSGTAPRVSRFGPAPPRPTQEPAPWFADAPRAVAVLLGDDPALRDAAVRFLRAHGPDPAGYDLLAELDAARPADPEETVAILSARSRLRAGLCAAWAGDPGGGAAARLGCPGPVGER